MTKTFSAALFDRIPGGLGKWHELRQSLKVLAGILFTILLPQRRADDVFSWIAKNRRAKYESRLDRDPIVKRIKALLKNYCSDDEIRVCGQQHYDWRIEDFWARIQASHKSDQQVQTEVVGLEHVTQALQQGHGVVFWGMSFCGTLFSKIALARAGVNLTQLSSADHGALFPLTLLGKWIAGPLQCLPEDRYLSSRIRIPVDGSNRYLYRIGDVLKKNGCIWIAGERDRPTSVASGQILGLEAKFPVGAPTLALRHKAALLPVHTDRLGRFNYRLTIEKPISLDNSLPRKETVRAAVQEYSNRLNARILQGPGEFEWNNLWARNLSLSKVDHSH